MKIHYNFFIIIFSYNCLFGIIIIYNKGVEMLIGYGLKKGREQV